MRKVSDLLGASPYGGEDPEVKAMNDSTKPRPDYTHAPLEPPETYNWVATPMFVLVNDAEHKHQFDTLRWDELTQPYGMGTLDLRYQWDAEWSINAATMAVQQLERVLKKYTKENGWNWQGMKLPDGTPFGKTGRQLLAEYPGIGEILPGEKTWKQREWSGMEAFDSPGHEMREGFPFSGQDPHTNESVPTSTYTCSDCGFPADSISDWRGHIMKEHTHPGGPDPEPTYIGPPPDLDDALPANWNEGTMDQTVMRQAGWVREAAEQLPIPGSVPFLFDIEQDRIYVGHPGERTSDINARITPGGMVEGMYDPKGDVQIRTDTDMPYTVKHMGELWQAIHPELPIKSIYLLVGDNKHKLANSNIGHQVKNLLATDPAAWTVYKELSPFGTVYVVGGAVRDVVLGKQPRDFDLLVQGVSVEDVQSTLERLPGRVDYTGKSFGVLRYKDPDGNEVEVALPRSEKSTGTGHQDFDVQSNPLMSVEEDLGRRDFTGNAMAVNLDTGELIDPHDGSVDIKNGDLNTVSDKSFEEDPLRILRVLTSISRHGLTPTREVLQEIKKNAYLLDTVSAERIQHELDKMMMGNEPAKAISLLEDTGVFKHILPEYEKTFGFDQRSPHHTDELHDHMKNVLTHMTKLSDDPDLRWAAWLHDIGKPRSQWMDESGTAHYYENQHGHGADHWTKGAEMTKGILGRMKFPNDRTDRISHLIEHHMFPRFENERGARKFVNKVGGDHADDLLKLRAADTWNRPSRHDDVAQMQELVNRVKESAQPTDTSMLALNGNDLINSGFQPGPQMGQLLKWLTDQVIENPELNTKDQLLDMAAGTWDSQRQANILDPVKSSLDGDVFDNSDSLEPRVKPKLIKWLKEKIYHTMIEAGWPDPSNYLSLVLTGSLTTYQWSDRSDMDISLWVDTERFPDWVRADLIKLMIEKCDGTIAPGTTHPIQCFVVNINTTTREELYKPGLRSAYDLEAKEWIVPPERSRAVDVNKLYHAAVLYAQGCAEKMKMMLKFGDDGAVKIYWDFLHRRRFLDMQAGKGDFAESNIVLKMLENEDLYGPISDATGEHVA